MSTKTKPPLVFAFLILIAFIHPASSSPLLQLTIYTAKQTYNIEENISIYGYVKTDGAPIESAAVGLEVRDPSSSPVIIRVLTTNALGEYDLSFKLSSQALQGTYTVNVTCSYLGEKATNATSFNLEKASSFVLTVNMGRSAYKSEETVEIFGNTTLAGVPIANSLVAVEVQDPKNTPILVRVVETETNGLYSLTFQLQNASLTGTYTVHASASYEAQKATATTMFEVKQEMPADINKDGAVDIQDIVLVAVAWDSQPGDPRWDPRCDLDGNNDIDIIDITLVAIAFGT
jgi:uncharacterized protein YfaS (alpha-2-macroglobulin family)